MNPKFEVNHYTSHNKILYLKVIFPELGMYLNSFTARPSVKFPDSGLWIQTPKYNVRGKWISPIEFDKDSDLWKQIELACIKSVQKPLEEDLDLDDIRF